MARPRATDPKAEAVSPVHPKLAEHMVAHTEIEKQLLQMFNAKRLPHAILFTGPRGIGKATLAYRFARFLLAPQEAEDGLFGAPLPPESLFVPSAHPTFRRLVAGAHPDFLALEADDIKVEEARSVAAFLALTPAESQWRVVVIDSADAMNRNAANALLKILEEPPARAVLLLVSHNPGSLLPTIRSRCRVMRVPALVGSDFARVMAAVLPELTPEQAQTWALLSGGSPGVALTLQQSRADILYRDLLECIAGKDVVKHHAFADRFARKDASRDWQVLVRLFLWTMARIASGAGSHEIYAGEHAVLERLRRAKPLDTWLELWEKAEILLADTDNLHLDKKQAILSLLSAASG